MAAPAGASDDAAGRNSGCGQVADTAEGGQAVAHDVMMTSPEPALLQRAGVGGTVRHQTSLCSSSDGGGSGDSSSGSSPRRLAVRCRLNGTTPTVMAVTSRVRRCTTETAVLEEGQATAGACLISPMQQQQQEVDTICLLDSD